jgi:hypothetical protein
MAWGNKHFAPEGASVQVINTKTGAVAEPILVDRATGQPIAEPNFRFAAGPAASDRARLRYASVGRADAKRVAAGTKRATRTSS